MCEHSVSRASSSLDRRVLQRQGKETKPLLYARCIDKIGEFRLEVSEAGNVHLCKHTDLLLSRHVSLSSDFDRQSASRSNEESDEIKSEIHKLYG